MATQSPSEAFDGVSSQAAKDPEPPQTFPYAKFVSHIESKGSTTLHII